MAQVREQVEAELENIERVIAELPSSDLLPNLSSLEPAGIAALVHNFYNGTENILKQLIIASGRELPQSSSWHQELVNIAAANDIISKSTAEKLRRYLAFRHFFSHAYSFDIDKERIIPLVRDMRKILTFSTNDINKIIRNL